MKVRGKSVFEATQRQDEALLLIAGLQRRPPYLCSTGQPTLRVNPLA
jgi:hypothetical protein